MTLAPRRRARSRGLFPALALSILLTAAACAPAGAPRFFPPPAEILCLEGHGSASIAGAEAAVRGRFAFVFAGGDRGRIDAFDALGRTLYFIVFDGRRAVLAIPSRKVYWETGPAEMMDRFLGFRLTLPEIQSLFTGRWEAAGPAPAAPPAEDWVLERDDGGRVVRGVRDTLVFEIRAFFQNTAVPRQVDVLDPNASGRIRVLDIRFNTPVRPEAFDLGLLRRLRPVDWAEIEIILRG